MSVCLLVSLCVFLSVSLTSSLFLCRPVSLSLYHTHKRMTIKTLLPHSPPLLLPLLLLLLSIHLLRLSFLLPSILLAFASLSLCFHLYLSLFLSVFQSLSLFFILCVCLCLFPFALPVCLSLQSYAPHATDK